MVFLGEKERGEGVEGRWNNNESMYIIQIIVRFVFLKKGWGEGGGFMFGFVVF